MKNVLGIGSAFVDYFFETDEAFLSRYNLVAEDDRLFDEKKIMEDIFSQLPLLAKSPGGSTINTLAVLAALGISSSYLGILGKGEEEKTFFDGLSGVEFSISPQKGNMSKCACLLTHHRRKRTFISTMNPYDNDFFDHAKAIAFNIYDFCHITQLFLHPEKSLKKLGELREKITCPISFSPGAVYANFGLQALMPLVQRTQILFLSKYELSMLLKGDEKEASKKLLRYGPQIVVCTLGEKGALVTAKKEQFFAKAEKVENIVDTTGAGDAFAAGFLYLLLQGKSLRQSAAFANNIAAKSLTNFGLKWINDC